jgi:hypothetical protein
MNLNMGGLDFAIGIEKNFISARHYHQDEPGCYCIKKNIAKFIALNRGFVIIAFVISDIALKTFKRQKRNRVQVVFALLIIAVLLPSYRVSGPRSAATAEPETNAHRVRHRLTAVLRNVLRAHRRVCAHYAETLEKCPVRLGVIVIIAY